MALFSKEELDSLSDRESQYVILPYTISYLMECAPEFAQIAAQTNLPPDFNWVGGIFSGFRSTKLYFLGFGKRCTGAKDSGFSDPVAIGEDGKLYYIDRVDLFYDSLKPRLKEFTMSDVSYVDPSFTAGLRTREEAKAFIETLLKSKMQ